MMDNRWKQLAEVLVNYSTEIQPGEKVLITMMETETLPLARAVYAETVRSGGLPYIEFQSAYLERDLLLYGNQDQLDWVPEIQTYGMQWADAYIGLRGARNPFELANISNHKITAHKRAMGKISALRNEETRWVLIRVPNESFAQQASMSLDDMIDFFFRATLRDWRAEAEFYRKINEVFQASETVRIISQNTDLSFSTKGRVYVAADGHLNMPDGEIFTAPVDNSAEGFITFEFPGLYLGQKVEEIHLEFSQGIITRAVAKTNQNLLEQILEVDEGVKRIGEFGVGVNFGIDRFCYDILYDEKIGGTIHIALGRAYSECGGVNESSLHWDLIKDLRTQGTIYLDGQKVFEAGRFLFL